MWSCPNPGLRLICSVIAIAGSVLTVGRLCNRTMVHVIIKMIVQRPLLIDRCTLSKTREIHNLHVGHTRPCKALNHYRHRLYCFHFWFGFACFFHKTAVPVFPGFGFVYKCSAVHQLVTQTAAVCTVNRNGVCKSVYTPLCRLAYHAESVYSVVCGKLVIGLAGGKV